MEITGIQAIPAPRDAVWNALNNPDVLKACLPGCESVERTSPNEFRVIVAAAIGPLRARFTGVLRMTESHPPQSCIMVFEGQGGAVGFGKGSSEVTLRETPEGTELSYSAKAQVGGKLAQVGSRLIDSVARKMSDDFFKAFRKELSPTAPAPSTPEAPVAAPGSVAGAKELASVSISTAAEPAVAIGSPVMVPGWWLAVATVLGAATAIAGALLIH